ncbi:MAG: UvrD-helicase domain-containing protein [Desulfosarcina sp.]|nr:UvrD-helicase domain-containing protein [Desulfosarcina sp.]
MAQLMMHRDVLKGYHKLPTKVQKKVAGFMDRFQVNPADPSLHVHKLDEMMADSKVRGANLPDGYRAIIIAPEQGDTYLMVHIDTHDKAYAWAKNKRFEMHPKTGVFQVFDVEKLQAAVEQQPEKPASPDDYPLATLSEAELFRAGVPEPLIPAVKAISSDESLEALSDYLPKDCRDLLVGIAAGLSLDEALEEMLGIATVPAPELIPEGPGDFTNVAERANFDLVLVKGEEHLKDILEAPLEEWRIFLHPYQKKLVEWGTKGPMNINGSAGTGKTVCLIHRAVYLANKLKDPKEKVLLTTFTTNLSITLKEYIRQMDSSAAEHIEVTNLHALSRTICTRSGWKGRIGDDEDFDAIWDSIWANPELGQLPMAQDEMVKEYWNVIDANGIDNEEDYLTTVRSARPRISRKQRRQAWPVFRAFQRGLKKRNILTIEGAIHQARLAVEQGNFNQYRHVLVDEAQDFSLEALKLIRALSPIKESLLDPLCTVGDGHQRIYRAKIPMSRAGIEIRGRSRRLKINYRTSEQIRKYAQAMLKGLEIDDLDGHQVSIAGDHSVFKGPEPIVEACKSQKDEAEAIVAWVQTLMDDHSLKNYEICITPYKPAIVTALTDANISILQLKPREVDPGKDEPGVRLGTIKRIKGLEFRAIALACAEPDDPMNHLINAEVLERCERYVAATRAREHLLVTIHDSRRSTPW